MALASALALGGCGAGDSTGGTVADFPSRAEFVKKANAICAEVFAKTSKQYFKLRYLNGGRPRPSELDHAAQGFMVPALSRLERRLRALGAPPPDEQQVEKMLDALDAGIETAAKDARTVRGETGQFAFGEAYELMWAYGLDECGLS